jgi:hypothetical protein
MSALAEHVEAYVIGLAEGERASIILEWGFGFDDEDEDERFTLRFSKRIEQAAETIPMDKDRVRQVELPAALAALAFDLFAKTTLRQLGKVEPLGYRVVEISAAIILDPADPQVRTFVIKQALAFTRDRVLVLPHLWFPPPSWTQIGLPRASSPGHSYIGESRGLSNDVNEKIQWFFLGTDNRLGDDALLEFQQTGRVTLDEIRRVKYRATDEIGQITLTLRNPTHAMSHWRSAVYPDASLLAPKRASKWREVDGDIEASWTSSQYNEGNICAIEWRLAD